MSTYFRKLVVWIVVLVSLTTVALAQTEVQEKNRRAVQTAFDNWRRGAQGTPFDLLASDVKWTNAGTSTVSGTYHSRRDFMEQVVTSFNSRLQTPLVPTVRGLYADGDTVIVLWDGAAIARDGKSYENTYSWYLKMRDGKITNVVAVYDSVAFDDLWKRIRPVY